ncbi:MAG TPA: avidin/streptavidin family protein [Bradyrhizobium sp.]
MKRFVCCLLLALGLATAARADGLPEWSIWKNPRESLLVISLVDTASGTFSGTFINNAKGYKCAGFGVPIRGKINGNTIVFVANFVPCVNTITAWRGTLGDKTISTSWQLFSADDDGNFKELKKDDVFTRVN